MAVSVHNPDQYMASLRTIIAQGRKRIGLLIGAGGPAGMAKADGSYPLIPAVAGLTDQVLKEIAADYGTEIDAIKAELAQHDIETIERTSTQPPDSLDDPAARARLRIVEQVVKNRVADKDAGERIIARARERLAGWLERGAVVEPIVSENRTTPRGREREVSR